MKLLGEVGDMLSYAPQAQRQLRLALWAGGAAGLCSVCGIASLAWSVVPLLHTARFTTASMWSLALSITALLLSFLLRQRADALAHSASYQLEVGLRRSMTAHLARLPLGMVQDLGAGRIKKIILDDIKGLHIAVADAVPFIGLSLSQPLAALLVLAAMQWRLALAALIMLPFSLICMRLMMRDHQEQRQRYNQANEDINAAVIELVQGMPVMRTFDNGQAGWNRYTVTLRNFTQAVADWMAASKRPWKTNRILGAELPTLLAIALSGVLMLWGGMIGLDQLLLALMIGSLPIQAIEPLMHLTNYLNDANAAARRIKQFMAQPPLQEPDNPQKPLNGTALTFDNVCFYYPNQAQPALHNISLTLPPGCHCAIVGASGSGKSTLARLIPRFYDVTSGAIRLGGTDIRDIASAQLLQQMALVLQEPFLIAGTLEQNLMLAKPDASPAQLQVAIRAAGVDEIVRRLPAGLQTQVGERGAALSGGQRQRITLARALLADAPILILDEATAFIDANNQRAIQQALNRLCQGKTVITIAHRLGGIVDADLILMMHRGEIVETGTHEQLLAQQGHYARLCQHYQQTQTWTLQREGYHETLV